MKILERFQFQKPFLTLAEKVTFQLIIDFLLTET